MSRMRNCAFSKMKVRIDYALSENKKAKTRNFKLQIREKKIQNFVNSKSFAKRNCAVKA